MIEPNSSSGLSILVGSFNIHKLHPPPEIDLSSWLTYPSITPQIIAIGLQELPLTFTFLQQKSEYEWMKLLGNTLPNHRLLSRVRLNGMILFIYIQSSHFDQCSSIATAKVPTGFMNFYGNKGSVGMRFELNQTSLCFLNCHLSAGENPSALQLRNEQFSLIHQRMSFKSQCEKFQWNINEHHGVFFFGDLNYRQTKSQEDELKNKTDILKRYSESPIKFPPTYKYNLNADSYNSSRRSSWTDRILYRKNECRIQPIDYWSTWMIRFSDHRPMALLNRLWVQFSGDTKQLQKQTDVLKMGILGAANICNMALISPASKLANILIYGIAARDRQKAEAFARKHCIPKVYDNYDQLLADPDITMIYNPLPNGLHYEWTMKALRSGKHVLCEKPLTNNADEAREMVEEARKQNRLLVEAFHYRYHPVCYETLRNVISNHEEIGAIQNISGVFTVPATFLKANDIRFQYSLGGGAQMDLGCYLVSMCRFIVNTYRNRSENNDGPFTIEKAEALRVSPTNPQIDYGMRSEFTLDGIKCHTHNEFTNNWSFFKQQIVIECERATVTVAYLIAPVFYHYLTIRQRDNGQIRTIKNYSDNQSTYYYQLKAFTEAVRIVRDEGSLDRAYEIAYTTGQSAIRNMEIIDEIYRKAGLVVRGTKI